jgi:hypothetical protein
MSYILHSSIARAGGIDLLLGTEAFSHPPEHPVRRRRVAGRTLRQRLGRGMILAGRRLAAWGAKWSPQSACEAALPDPKPVM